MFSDSINHFYFFAMMTISSDQLVLNTEITLTNVCHSQLILDGLPSWDARIADKRMPAEPLLPRLIKRISENPD